MEHIVIRKRDIAVQPTRRCTKKVPGMHLTGWWLSYTFPNGNVARQHYQAGFYDLKKALHEFFKNLEKNLADRRIDRSPEVTAEGRI